MVWLIGVGELLYFLTLEFNNTAAELPSALLLD